MHSQSNRIVIQLQGRTGLFLKLRPFESIFFSNLGELDHSTTSFAKGLSFAVYNQVFFFFNNALFTVIR